MDIIYCLKEISLQNGISGKAVRALVASDADNGNKERTKMIPMRRQVWIFLVIVAALFAIPVFALQTFKFAKGQRIYVVAVRTVGDAPLFNRCPPTYLPPGVRRSGPFMPSSRAPFQGAELFEGNADPVPGGIPDAAMKANIEDEFQKQKQYRIVAAAADADLVFIVEARFLAIVTATMKSTENPIPPEFTRPEWGSGPGSGPPNIVFSPSASTATYFNVAPDEKPNLLQMAMAIVVPADVYRQNPDYSASLLKARLWEGMVGGQNEKTASPVSLAKQFGAKSKASRGAVICATPQVRHAPAGPTALQAELSRREHDAKTPVLPEPHDPPTAKSSIKADADLVSVPVMVTDEDGKPVSDLKASQFHLFEDGIEQKIDRVLPGTEPVKVALVIDTSQSMRFKDEGIQRAALAFVRSLPPEFSITVVSFNSRVYLDSEFSADRDRLVTAISQMRTGDGTRLYDAVKLTITERLRYLSGRKAIVLFTDGVDTLSGLADAAGTLEMVEESDVPVYVIQYETIQNYPRLAATWKLKKAPEGYVDKDQVYARGSQYLQDLSNAGGGRLDRARNSVGDLKAFSDISEELRHQYTLCYHPGARDRNRSLHRIRVEIDQPGVKVRARASIRAGAQPKAGK